VAPRKICLRICWTASVTCWLLYRAHSDYGDEDFDTDVDDDKSAQLDEQVDEEFFETVHVEAAVNRER
jgi:hypothetical protein